MTDNNTRRRGARRLTAGLLALLLPLGLGAYFGLAAFAAVAPAPVSNSLGAGGYDSTTANPAGFTDGQDVLLPNQYSLTIATGNQGVQGCSGTSGESVKVGLHSTNTSTVFAAQWAVGAAAGCPTNGPLTGVDFPGLTTVPYLHHTWLHWQLVNRVKVIKILVCVLFDRQHKPVPTPSPTVALPTASATGTETATATPTVANPTASATSASPTVNPQTATPTPTGTATAPAGTTTENPVPGGFEPGQHLPGFFIKCHLVIKRIVRTVAVVQAQDLDAPTITPVATDLPGPQTVIVPLPNGTVFDHSSWGATEDTTNMQHCTGPAADLFTYPRLLAGPAGYTTTACQPADEAGYVTTTVGSGTPVDPTTLTTSELISPSTSALVAPNNTLVATTPLAFPKSTDPGASTSGGHFSLFLGNAPVG